jgi:photosystem II stability/assembly factor-like uncharacterized protein
MFKTKALILSCLLLGSAFVLSGCGPIQFQIGGGGGNDGGVFVSTNKGRNWKQMVEVPTIGEKSQSIGNTNATALVMDPSDHDAVYYGTSDNGLFYSYNVANGWMQVNDLPAGKVDAVAVDPNSKCLIYASIENKIYKTTDCNRTWNDIYYDNQLKTRINTLAVDHYDGTRIYAGTTRGEILTSRDRGESWKTLERFDSSVEEINIDPFDSRQLFLATEDDGLFRSSNKGESWVSLESNMEDFSDRSEYRDLLVSPAQEGLVLLATNYGLLRSTDHGDSWERLELITPEEDAKINSVAVNPQNQSEIYYVTNTTFYGSTDRGVNWSTRKLPSSRRGAKLLIDFENPNIIYLGVSK